MQAQARQAYDEPAFAFGTLVLTGTTMARSQKMEISMMISRAAMAKTM